MIVFTVYVPSNRGLRYAREQGLNFLQENFKTTSFTLQEQRGEDIARLVSTLYEDSNPVVGITGEDLLDDFLLTRFGDSFGYDIQYRELMRRRMICKKLNLIKKNDYEDAVFGLPALCILGKGGISLDRFLEAYPSVRNCEIKQLRGTELQEPDFAGKKVAIPQRYEALIRSRARLTDANILLLDGKVDVTAARGDADYAIDIVVTGKTCRDEGLGFFPPVLYLSDGVVLGNRRTQQELGKCSYASTPISDFDLWINGGRTSEVYSKGNSAGDKFSH